MTQLGLRERKKLQMRAEIVAVAERLFAEHGFDNVTLPQVAEAAGVSVKTVFNYFRLKEDLAFADEDQICATWLHCIRNRPAGSTPFEAVRDQIRSGLGDVEAIDRLLRFQEVVDSSRALAGRQRIVWDRLETVVGQMLAAEADEYGTLPAPSARYAAAQLVNVVRLLYTPEMREFLEARPAAERVAALAGWLDEVLALADRGLGDRYRRAGNRRVTVESGEPLRTMWTPVAPGAQPPPVSYRPVAPRVSSPRVAELASVVTSDSTALERFWAEVSSAGVPLIEPATEPGRQIVTFLWRGTSETQSVVVQANKLFSKGDYSSATLELLEHTDVWHLSYSLPDRWRGSYQFLVAERCGTSSLRSDPLNPQRFAHPPGPDKSIASLPDAPPQPAVAPRATVRRATMTEHRFSSSILGNERRVWAHAAGVSEDDDRPLSTLVMFDGALWAESLDLRTTMDNLVADGLVDPTLVLMVDSVEPGLRSRELPCNPEFVSAIVDELLPWASQRWSLADDRTRRTVAGQSLGGLAALYTGLVVPEVFGNCLSQSGSFWWRNTSDPAIGEPLSERDLRRVIEAGPEWLTARFLDMARTEIDGPDHPLNVWLEVGCFEGENVETNRRIEVALAACGHRATLRTFVGGHDRACWRGGVADGLIALSSLSRSAQAY